VAARSKREKSTSKGHHRAALLPPLRAIQVFEAVGRCGSVSRAADELGVSPGAVTQQIHGLEKHLKVRLVQRSGRGIELTNWGTIYLQRVAAGLEQLHQAQQDLERARRSNDLKISALPSLSTKWVGPLLFAWKKQYPDARLSLDANDAEPRLEEGEVDFRLSYGSRRRHYPRYTRLFSDFVTVVASPALLASDSPLKHPRELLKRNLLWIDWGPEYAALPTWRDWFALLGISADRLRADLTFSTSSAAIDAAIEGRGFALAQNSMIASALSSGALTRVYPQALPVPDFYFLAWNGAALDKPVGAAFHAWIVAEARRFDFEDKPVSR
jgi:LysR family glycine cleavage system transcriptional activator